METETAQNGTAAQIRMIAKKTDTVFFNITDPPEPENLLQPYYNI